MTQFAEGKTNPILMGREETLFDMTDDGAVLIVRFNNPTQKEIEQFSAGKRLEIAVSVYKDIIFLLTKFGNLSFMDAPYTVHMSLNLRNLEKPQKDSGYALNIIFCGTDGMVYKMRLVTMPYDVSTILYDEIQRQKMQYFDWATHNSNIKFIYQRYSTMDLLQKAKVRTVINM